MKTEAYYQRPPIHGLAITKRRSGHNSRVSVTKPTITTDVAFIGRKRFTKQLTYLELS